MSRDRDLIQIVDAALAESARLSGHWLACRPGCFECCIGPFPITALDAARLREGLAALDPERAATVLRRARQSVARLERDYPGDTVVRLLEEDGPADSEPCPALDPDTGTCDLYEARPLTCRTFGPPLRFNSESIAICELCFDGAAPEEIAACEVEIDAGNLEAELLHELGDPPDTIVAYALLAVENDGRE